MQSFSFEYFKTNRNIFPFAYVGGQIAGQMAVLYANHFLQNQFGGAGVSLFHVDGATQPHVAVIGYGHVGGAAIQLLLSIGCKVSVFCRDTFSARKAFRLVQGDIEVYSSTEENYCKVLPKVDALIGSILISTNETSPIVTDTMIKTMKKGAVIVDVTAGYGSGYLPSIRDFTTLEAPYTTTESGQNYIKINNFPSAYPKTSSEAYGNQLFLLLPRLLCFLEGNQSDTFISSGRITYKGLITNPSVKHDIINETTI